MTSAAPNAAGAVPPSKRGRLLRRLLSARGGRTLEITRSGWLFILLTLAVGFAAINSGSNLMHAIFGAQTAMIIGSGVLSERAVWRAHASRRAEGALFARTPSAVRVEIENTSTTAEVLSVSVEDDPAGVTAATCAPVFSVRLLPGEARTLSASVTMPRRGRHAFPTAVIATRFPFGLFVKRRAVQSDNIVTVYPHVEPVAVQRETVHRPGRGDESGRRARVGEFFGLREYTEGDDPRRIYWPALARLSRPVVREHEALGDTERFLDLPSGRTGDDRFERDVERVASMAVGLLASPGIAVGIRHAGHVVIPPASGSDARRHILEFLAVVGGEVA